MPRNAPSEASGDARGGAVSPIHLLRSPELAAAIMSVAQGLALNIDPQLQTARSQLVESEAATPLSSFAPIAAASPEDRGAGGWAGEAGATSPMSLGHVSLTSQAAEAAAGWVPSGDDFSPAAPSLGYPLGNAPLGSALESLDALPSQRPDELYELYESHKPHERHSAAETQYEDERYAPQHYEPDGPFDRRHQLASAGVPNGRGAGGHGAAGRRGGGRHQPRKAGRTPPRYMQATTASGRPGPSRARSPEREQLHITMSNPALREQALRPVSAAWIGSLRTDAASLRGSKQRPGVARGAAERRGGAQQLSAPQLWQQAEQLKAQLRRGERGPSHSRVQAAKARGRKKRWSKEQREHAYAALLRHQEQLQELQGQMAAHA